MEQWDRRYDVPGGSFCSAFCAYPNPVPMLPGIGTGFALLSTE